MVDVCDLLIFDRLKLLLKVLMRHYLVVTPKGLDYLLPVLINDDGLAKIAAAFICEFVDPNRVRARLVADRDLAASAFSLFQVN